MTYYSRHTADLSWAAKFPTQDDSINLFENRKLDMFDPSRLTSSHLECVSVIYVI